MQPIPRPQLLDPDRVINPARDNFTADHESRAEELEKGLHKSCEYAQQLWEHLDEVRRYLMESLPPDPRSPEAGPRTCASPTGPDDEEGWNRWIHAFAAVTSVLCGPHGDSGYGLSEAQHAAEIRRTAPTVRVFAEHQPNPPIPATESSSGPVAAPAPAAAPARSKAKVAALAALAVLALRGLRPRRG